ncbi:PREDICTED: transcription factor CP2-like protein 1 isoform X2 [Ficedula albicollis]|uniref:transcription factor CP2-like protein 1 isoform X2 n=1 Tax=Ficedula albicollis TaxID=59894 RepID=UPI0003597665|nr:PREDICTED: transcription factor CP2-like protein 1 isoform X2 [Ficedula albicollis]
MLFWHGQPDHYWSSPGDMYPLPSSGGLRDPPVLPYLKQEEPNGISTSQPPLPAFQYVLSAPTSPAVRHHEETLTYLNQGQSYEIRMMGTARGDPAEGRRMVKTRFSPVQTEFCPSPASSEPQFSPISTSQPQFYPSSAPILSQSSPISASVLP